MAVVCCASRVSSLIHQLITRWREQAAVLEPYAPAVAHALRECATETEAALRQEASELISLAEAALVSGYNVDSLGAMIRDGRLSNYGNKRRPKVKRSEIPKKPGARRVLDLSVLALDARS